MFNINVNSDVYISDIIKGSVRRCSLSFVFSFLDHDMFGI